MSPERPRFRIPEHVLARKLDDEMVLLNLDSGEYFGLNDTGTRVWELLADGCSRQQIVDRLTEEFEVAADDASGHVTALCDELVEAGLLATGGEASG
ncbi:MAG: PqqD family protein [Thermoanaerobaculia bacterium]